MSDAAANLNDIATIVANWQAARAKEAEWKKAKEELGAVIIDTLGDREVGTINGQPVVSLKRIKKTALSQKLLRQLHPDVFDECSETTEQSSGLRLIDGA